MICYITAPVITVTSLQILAVKHALILGAGIIITNHYLSPDLDIDSIMNKRWGILHWIWKPYQVMFRHRSLFTHSGPLSATLRLLYLLWPLLLIIPKHDILFYARMYSLELLIFYSAACISDMLHTGADIGTTILSRFWKKPRTAYRGAK